MADILQTLCFQAIYSKVKANLVGNCRFVTIAFVLSLTFAANLANAQEEGEEAGPMYAYIALEPDIVTNYAGDNSKNLGYLRITIEMMLDNPVFIMDVEHHMPLLRAAAIEIVGAQPEQQVKSLTGREEIRRIILKRFQDILLKETGNGIVKDVIFTKYLRQGG